MTELFGRPIEGDINHYTSEPAEQHDPQLFLDALDKLLDTEGVEAVRWTAYTPYFADGDACEYGNSFEGVKLTFGNDDGGDYENGFYGPYSLYDYDDYNKRWEDRVRTDILNGHGTKHIQEAIKDFESVLSSGHHYVMLKKAFGDPAEVTATKAGFSVEYYDHD